MFRFFRALGVILLVVSSSFSAINVAVNDLSAKGIDSSRAAAISEQFRREMVNADGVYKVIERAEMGKILKEQQFQQTGMCDDASCAVQMGQALGVTQILVGQIAATDSGLLFSARLIDVGSSQVMASASETAAKGAEDETIRWIVDQFAFAAMKGQYSWVELHAQPADAVIRFLNDDRRGQWRSARLRTSGTIPVTVARPGYYPEKDTLSLTPGSRIVKSYILKPRVGSLTVSTTPDSALVSLNGKGYGLTPFKTDGIPAGSYELRITKKGYLPVVDSISIEGGGAISRSFTLARSGGTLAITSLPDSAAVLINGKSQGFTPYSAELPAGAFDVRLVKNGFYTENDSVFIENGGTVNRLFPLRRSAAILKITTVPAGAFVTINGRDIGTTPFSGSPDTGRVLLSVSLSGYAAQSESLVVAPGAEINRSFQLRPQFAKLTITTSPDSALVNLDGRDIGKTPFVESMLAAGMHRFKISRSGFAAVLDSINAEAGVEISRTYVLQKDAGLIAQKKKSRQWARRIAFGVLAAGAGAFGGIMQASSSAAYDDAIAADSEYKKASSQAQIDQYKNLRDSKSTQSAGDHSKALAGFGLAGLAGILFVVSIPF